MVRYAKVRNGTVRYGVVDKIGLPAVAFSRCEVVKRENVNAKAFFRVFAFLRRELHVSKLIFNKRDPNC